MDIENLLNEAKARFSHNSAKLYLKDKFTSKLNIAEQGGLWKASIELISFLQNSNKEKIILIDEFENPVEIDRKLLLDKLIEVYDQVMTDWYTEWLTLEKLR